MKPLRPLAGGTWISAHPGNWRYVLDGATSFELILEHQEAYESLLHMYQLNMFKAKASFVQVNSSTFKITGIPAPIEELIIEQKRKKIQVQNIRPFL